MRVRRPSWFEPIRGFGEWVGFLGGSIVAAAVIAFMVLLVKGIVNSVSVTVRNDSHLTVAIDLCNDGTEFIHPGETFKVNELPHHDQFHCIVSFREGQEQCVVIPHVREIRGTIDLSQLVPVPRSRC